MRVELSSRILSTYIGKDVVFVTQEEVFHVELLFILRISNEATHNLSQRG